jgi:hypothetical protein
MSMVTALQQQQTARNGDPHARSVVQRHATQPHGRKVGILDAGAQRGLGFGYLYDLGLRYSVGSTVKRHDLNQVFSPFIAGCFKI